MQRHSVIRLSVTVASAAALFGAFWAGTAYAADARIGEARTNVTRAIELVKAAENKGVKPPFGGHREKALNHLSEALKQIDQMKSYADSHPPANPCGTPFFPPCPK